MASRLPADDLQSFDLARTPIQFGVLAACGLAALALLLILVMGGTGVPGLTPIVLAFFVGSATMLFISITQRKVVFRSTGLRIPDGKRGWRLFRFEKITSVRTFPDQTVEISVKADGSSQSLIGKGSTSWRLKLQERDQFIEVLLQRLGETQIERNPDGSMKIVVVNGSTKAD